MRDLIVEILDNADWAHVWTVFYLISTALMLLTFTSKRRQLKQAKAEVVKQTERGDNWKNTVDDYRLRCAALKLAYKIKDARKLIEIKMAGNGTPGFTEIEWLTSLQTELAILGNKLAPGKAAKAFYAELLAD